MAEYAQEREGTHILSTSIAAFFQDVLWKGCVGGVGHIGGGWSRML